LSKSAATTKGHLNQQRQNARTTQIKANNTGSQESDIDHGIKTQFVYAATIDAGQIYTDQTGRFPVVSSKGNKYIMIILAQPIKDRTAPELLKAFKIIEQELVARGLKPKLMRLDNEASKLLKSYLHQQDITFQLVPPYSHIRNSAERAIRSFKDHLIAGLCSTDKSFPMHLWERLLPQAVITLNMLGTSRINPKLSAATHIFGQYDFNRAPMAPPGTIIIAHETPNHRSTWAPHGLDGWYLGPALEHYICYTVHTTKTRGDRIVETVDFFPEKCTLPFPTPQDQATKAATELTRALLHPQPAGPFCQVGDAQTLALKRLAAIFEGATQHKTKINVPPTKRNDNNSHHSDSVPNSHRRLNIPSMRVVAPHAMVRCNATQQYNLSQDMMAESLNQAHHCFSISPNEHKQKTKSSITHDNIIIMPEMANAVICPYTGKSLKHNELLTKLRYRIKWMRSTANEINRLYNTNTIRFIQRSNIPKGRKVTYGSFVVDIKDQKEEKERTLLTVEGDQIEYPGDKSTHTAGLTTSNILINSVISTMGAKFLVIDIKNFYLNTPLGRFEYMLMNLSSLPQ
jgi:hypothetical protein